MADSLITIGISMPYDFPRGPYEAVHQQCQPKMTPDPPLGEKWDQYAFAWNAAAYRFRATTEYDEGFTAAIRTQGAEERYSQERQLFGFFVSGLSTLECVAYGLYFLASIAHRRAFPKRDPQSITLNLTAQEFVKQMPSEPLGAILDALVNNPEYEEWKTIRNILAHRCTPGRIINLGGQTPQDDIWKLDNIPLNPDITNNRRL